jgi:hypothetical protein
MTDRPVPLEEMITHQGNRCEELAHTLARPRMSTLIGAVRADLRIEIAILDVLRAQQDDGK